MPPAPRHVHGGCRNLGPCDYSICARSREQTGWSVPAGTALPGAHFPWGRMLQVRDFQVYVTIRVLLPDVARRNTRKRAYNQGGEGREWQTASRLCIA